MQNLVGIVACGGLSNRMGVDKSNIKYHSIEQKYYLYNMLKMLCDDVYISCNKNQVEEINAEYSYIEDDVNCQNIGPMACLITANKKLRNSAFLVVGCDYPQLELEDLLLLKKVRNNNYDAFCYTNSATNFDEPLLAIYEESAMQILNENFEKKEYSLRKLLGQIKTIRIELNNIQNILSVDTPQQFKHIFKKIKNSNE